MIRVACKKCKNYDIFGTLKNTLDSGTIPRPKEELYAEISRFFKIPTETIKKKGDELVVPCCLICTPQVREEYDYNNNVDGKMTSAKNASKRRAALAAGKEKGGRTWGVRYGKNK